MKAERIVITIEVYVRLRKLMAHPLGRAGRSSVLGGGAHLAVGLAQASALRRAQDQVVDMRLLGHGGGSSDGQGRGAARRMTDASPRGSVGHGGISFEKPAAGWTEDSTTKYISSGFRPKLLLRAKSKINLSNFKIFCQVTHKK